MIYKVQRTNLNQHYKLLVIYRRIDNTVVLCQLPTHLLLIIVYL